MRTHHQEVRALQARNKVKTFLDGSRNYSVEGHIVFHSDLGTIETPLPQLREAILEVDKLFPWKDDIYPDARDPERESIMYLSPGEKGGGWKGETNLWFHLVPLWQSVRKGQVYAYEKYLAKLAEELAKKKLQGVESVRVKISMYRMTEFPCE